MLREKSSTKIFRITYDKKDINKYWLNTDSRVFRLAGQSFYFSKKTFIHQVFDLKKFKVFVYVTVKC